jgi:hypothetical protein
MVKEKPVSRPIKATEHKLMHVTREAEKGWRDACASFRNAMADAWDFLTHTPTQQSERCYPLRPPLDVVTFGGTSHTRWQYKISHSGRIWYAVIPPAKGMSGTVLIERVETGHPIEPEPGRNFR